MVNSILNSEINYPEIKYLDPDDKVYDAPMYLINILNTDDVTIALGQAKYTFIDKDIIYYPIYLVRNEKVCKQIGVYEIMSNELMNVMDEDNDIELNKIDAPLLYSFVNDELLMSAKKYEKEKDDEEEKDEKEKDEEENDEEENDEEENDEEENDEEEKDSNNEDDNLPEQNEKQVENEMDEYIDDKKNLWVQKYFKSPHYRLIDNEGGGDCLFAVIRDAMQATGRETTVLDLRNKLANEVTQDLYDNYKELYNMYAQNINENSSDITNLKKDIIDYKERLKNSKDRSEQEVIISNAKNVANKYKIIKSEKEVSTELITEFNFMKNIHSVDDLKKIIKTCEFWGDTWAISTLERILNIKLIIFSSEAWEQGDIANVLQCGHLNDPILEENGVFEPQYYIMLDYTGNHYKLITYRHHKIFTFSEIPYAVKFLITAKCLEKNAGPYSIIPQFQLFNKQLGIDEPIELDIEVIKEPDNELYINDIVFQYYIKSNNKPLPGKGIGEKIPNNLITEFSTLSKIPEWRRKLDNEYESPFELDGEKWKTVEHYYQASKFKNTNKEFYLLFALGSKSKISSSVDIAQAAASKNGKYKKDQLRPKDINIDNEFFNGMNMKVLEKALYAKFSQDNDMKSVLLNTKKAKLMLYKPRSEPEQSDILMLVRNQL
jgi:predicted NAD-dependent protein-ADP-ribosyltransferase YbiA (DUF1768 family)